MATIKIQNLQGLTVEANGDRTLLDQILDNQIDWMHACGKKGRCTSCKAIVLSGMDNLSVLSAFEEKMRDQKRLGKKERQTCQARIENGEVILKVPKPFQFPHMDYSE